MQESKERKCSIEPGQEWEACLFQPEDAERVVNLFLSVYGRGYPIKTYLDPELLIRENEAGRIISSVAKTPRGEIVGHDALFCSAPYTGIREAGAGVVHANYRGGQGIFTRLVDHGAKEGARRFGVEAVYGECVCNHIFSQKMCRSLGWISHALEVDLMPASAYQKEESAAGRVASILDLLTLKPKPHKVFIPPVYEDECSFLYSGLDDRREISKAGGQAPPNSRTRIQVGCFDFAQVARIAVWEPGYDFEAVFELEEKKVLEKGGLVVQVWLNLSYPWVDEAVHILRKKGYFLGGILPRWFDHDGLLMQKIMKRPDWESMQIHFDRAKRIRDLVYEDWLRVSASGS
ncbi:MAG: hypothetical protein CVU64_20610 [Deltaproteobacteria bacterium HGW-Deltaproteobacteria-21]|nr:MAG: hypothetical protein CVU64_20610 [Deltaproteobacteria bacterium HGW-Deltaproteobacteria-21]